MRRLPLQRIADVAIPVLVGLFLVLVVLDPEVAGGPRKLVGLALAVVQGGALWWRRTRPEISTAVVLGAAFAFQLLFADVVLPVAGFFAVGSLAAARPPRVSLLGLAGLVGVSTTNFFTAATTEDAVFTLGLCVGAWALGEASRNRRAALREEARRAVSEEQARIARELHDVIAHSVSVIVVQAGAADHVFDEKPEQARAALRSIEAAGRDVQRELRRLLAVVRPGLEPDAAAHPQPGLDRLDDLAVPLRAAGLRVEVRREGEARELPAGVDLSAYRIVQEALTNTLRHARASRAEVTVRYAPDALELSVVDDGRGTAVAGDGGGYGLVGMRERAAMLGGTLEAGAQAGGGYRVQARLPLESA